MFNCCCKSILVLLVLVVVVTCDALSLSNSTHKHEDTSTSDLNKLVKDVWSMVASMHSNDDTSPSEYRHSDTAEGTKHFDWRIKLDNLNRYELGWRVAYNLNEITFAININQTSSGFRKGYDVFALGFSTYGQFESSDFCLIWYDLSHQVHVQDARTDAQNRLQLAESPEGVCKLTGGAAHMKSSRKPGDNIQQSTPLMHRKLHHNHRSSYESSDTIQIVFKRPLEVCGLQDAFYTIDNGTTHLIWFAMKGPLLSLDGLNLTEMMSSDRNHVADHHQHQEANHSIIDHDSGANSKASEKHDRDFDHGMKRVQLIAHKSRGSQASSKGPVHDIRMEKFEIPARETTYMCKLFKLPHKFETRRYHITKYEAVIEGGNENVVHHMELFSCANLDRKQEQELANLYESSGWAGDCSGADRPKATDPCRKVVLAWAMGAQPLVYPEQVGQSIGGEGYSPFMVLEVHYNNIQSTAGLVDNSGLRFHYTSKLRPFDAGILEVGLEYTDKNSIPPNMVTPLAGYCVSECTRVALGSEILKNPELFGSKQSNSTTSGRFGMGTSEKLDEGIYIFAGQLHTHLTGVASWTEHIRQGQLVGELQRDNHYSPHFQEIRLLPEPVHIAPGDALVHYCLYDTRARKNITLGGFATSDEMCVTYLHYYPRVELEVCKSSVETQELEAYFDYLAHEESQNTSPDVLRDKKKLTDTEKRGYSSASPAMASLSSHGGKSVSENYRSIEWSTRRSEELIQFYSTAPLSVQCNRSNGQRYPGFWNGIEPTRLTPKPSLASTRNWTPFGSGHNKMPSAKELVNYRGRNHRLRHARCSQ